MGKKLLVTILILVAIIVAVVFVWREKRYSGIKLLPPLDLKISVYSLGGQVTDVGKDKIYFKAPVVYRTQDGGVVKYENKVALVDSQTKLVIRSATSEALPIFLSDFKNGDEIVAYTSQDPNKSSDFRADRIELIK